MGVVSIQVAREPRPTLLTVYCVRSYWRDRGRLVEGKLEQFGSMEAALRAAKVASRRSPFVRVTRIRGNIEADYWEDPVTIAKFGST